MYWDPTYAKWKFRVKSSNYALVTSCQVDPSWCNLHHKVSTIRQTVSPTVLLSSFFLLATFGQNCVQVFQRNCQWDLNETTHRYSWVVCGLQCKILLTSRMTLIFQSHNYIKSHFGPYLGSCWTNCHQILTPGSLCPGLSTNQKISWAVWTWDVRQRVRWPPLCKKSLWP